MAFQQLMTEELRKALPPIYANENIKSNDVKVIAHFFHPYGQGDWYVTEFDGEDMMFGWVAMGGDPELGYIYLPELVELRATVKGRKMPFQAIERDAHWTVKTWGEVCAAKGY